LKGWGLKFSNKLVEVPGRTLPLEKVFFSSTLSNGTRTIIDDLPNRDGEWTDSLKRKITRTCAESSDITLRGF
jgi:hypothetical protein